VRWRALRGKWDERSWWVYKPVLVYFKTSSRTQPGLYDTNFQTLQIMRCWCLRSSKKSKKPKRLAFPGPSNFISALKTFCYDPIASSFFVLPYVNASRSPEMISPVQETFPVFWTFYMVQKQERLSFMESLFFLVDQNSSR
jgi:hypothetical protein